MYRFTTQYKLGFVTTVSLLKDNNILLDTDAFKIDDYNKRLSETFTTGNFKYLSSHTGWKLAGAQ